MNYSEEEKEEYEELKNLLYTGQLSQYGKRKLIEIIETQKAEIDKKDNQLKEKNNIINKISLEAQRYFDTTIEQALKFDKELEKKDKQIDLMAEQLTTPINDKKWVIEYYTKLTEEIKNEI